MTFVIARAVNGITINGDEYVLDDEQKLIEFPSKKAAQQFLRDKGVKNPAREGIKIEAMARFGPGQELKNG